ncbi:glutamate--cysteine ligase [Streptomyces sp. NPDC020983]|uniref:glutamate--cysteine ligase n=1 Tax=Streptomyces sp. NPDC020983 TaxID=3365106 RepID=UPI0037A2D45E
MDAATLGVEEEYLLLDPKTGLPCPQVGEVQSAAKDIPFLHRSEVGNELLQAQIEIATPVCSDLTEVSGHLSRLRQTIARAADHTGCRLAATGAAPLAPEDAVPVSPKQRYHDMRAEARRLVDEQLICGMHVHVAVPDRERGAAALGRIRPWLPVLVALAANSPFWDGHDTGFAGWRTVVSGRWPVTGPPPHTAGAADYERETAALLATGVISDLGQIYWQARLSENYPTLEVRVCDVQLDVEAAVTLAGLTRALVTTALQEAEDGTEPLAPSDAVLRAAEWHAARHGVTKTLVHPVRGTLGHADEAVEAFTAHVTPALRSSGDLARVTAGLEQLREQGGGATLQREAAAESGLDGLLRTTSAAGKG